MLRVMRLPGSWGFNALGFSALRFDGFSVLMSGFGRFGRWGECPEPLKHGILGGSWVLISGVIRPLIRPTTHEPPSSP